MSVEEKDHGWWKEKGDIWSALKSGEDLLMGCRRLKGVLEGMKGEVDGGGESKMGILGIVEETMDHVKDMGRVSRGNVKVLVTGSIHLVRNF